MVCVKIKGINHLLGPVVFSIHLCIIKNLIVRYVRCFIKTRTLYKNETFWHDSDPWRIFSTSSRGLWAFPGALTYIYGIPTFICGRTSMCNGHQSSVRGATRVPGVDGAFELRGDSRELSDRHGGLL